MSAARVTENLSVWVCRFAASSTLGNHISSLNTNSGVAVWAGMKKKRRSAFAVTTPGRQVQTKEPASTEEHPSWTRVGRYRNVDLVRLRELFLLQPRSLSSWSVAIGRVVAPGCFSPFLLSSRASFCCPCHRMWLPGTGNAGFETRDRAARENSSRLSRLATPSSHTGAFESPMPDREPVSACTSRP